MFKFIELLNTNNMKILHNLSLYVYHAFQYQTEQLYVIGYKLPLQDFCFVSYQSE